MKIFPPAIDRFSTAFHPTIHTPSSLFTTYQSPLCHIPHYSYPFPLFPLSLLLLSSLSAVVIPSVCRYYPFCLL